MTSIVLVLLHSIFVSLFFLHNLGEETRTFKKVGYFELSDNGPGIPQDILDHIFDQGFSTKPKPKSTEMEAAGHGQGLWVCKKVIEEIHKGKIWVESELGKGTTFKFWLPLNKES